MVEITVDEHPTSSTRTKRTRIIIIVSVFVLLLAGIAAIVGTFIYRYYERTKIASKSIDYEPTHTNNVLPTVDLNVVKDGNTLNDDGLKSHDDRLEDKDQPLIVNKPVVLDPPAEDKNGREDDSPVTKPVVKDPSDKNKKKNEEALREQELRNQEKLKKLEEDRIMEQNRIDSINRKFDEEDKKKKQDSKPKEDKDKDKKKDTEPKKVDENPNVVEPKEEGDVDDKKFKEDLDRLLKEKLDRCKELNKVLEDVKDRKKQENPGKTMPESTPKVVIVSGSDAIFKRLDGFAAKKGIAVVRGDFEDCIIGRCEPAEGEYVFEWELRLIAEIMDEAKKPFDLKYEFETIKKYRDFSKKFSRFYFTKSSFKLSYSNFRITRDKVEKHNKNPDRLYSLDYTTFSDMGEEMPKLSPGKAVDEEKLSGFSRASKNLRDQVIHVDWRKEGIVQPVIHQGPCGACWAVAATDIFNSFRAKKNKDKTRYSHQQVLDCASPKYNCNRGGSQFVGLKYIRDNKMCSNDEYPYVSTKNQCSAYKCDKESGINDIVNLSRETALDFLKENGPFLTLLYCTSDFLLYSDGIFNGNCDSKNAHSVVVVGHGYDSVKNKNYWIVKNSWGTEWGEDGYVRVLDEQTDPTDPSKHFCNFLVNSHGIV